jgi:hypothetical protein
MQPSRERNHLSWTGTSESMVCTYRWFHKCKVKLMLRLQFFDQGGTTPVMRVRDQLTHVLVGMNDDTEMHPSWDQLSTDRNSTSQCACRLRWWNGLLPQGAMRICPPASPRPAQSTAGKHASTRHRIPVRSPLAPGRTTGACSTKATARILSQSVFSRCSSSDRFGP